MTELHHTCQLRATATRFLYSNERALEEACRNLQEVARVDQLRENVRMLRQVITALTEQIRVLWLRTP